MAQINPSDVQGDDPLALLRFQAEVEQTMFRAGDGSIGSPVDDGHGWLCIVCVSLFFLCWSHP